MRATYHIAVLALLGATTVGGIGGGEARSEAAAMAATASPTPTAGSQLISTSLTAPLSIGTAGGGEAGSTQQAVDTEPRATVLAPRNATPKRWVQNFKTTELFDGADATARSLGTAAQFSTFELLEDA